MHKVSCGQYFTTRITIFKSYIMFWMVYDRIFNADVDGIKCIAVVNSLP